MNRTRFFASAFRKTQDTFAEESRPVDRFHDLEQGDLVGRLPESEPAGGTLERDEEPLACKVL